MATELFANLASSTLSAGIASTDTSLSVVSAASFPAAVSGTSQFRIVVDSEIMIVTNVSGTTFTVTRGAESTTAAAHSSGAAVTHVVTAGSLSAAYVAKADPASALVATQEGTTSATFVNLATVGPAVTVTIGSSGRALVLFGANAQTPGSGSALANVEVSGASSVAAVDAEAYLIYNSAGSAVAIGAMQARFFTGLAPGSTTFTMKYRTSVGTSYFTNRRIIVIPL